MKKWQKVAGRAFALGALTVLISSLKAPVPHYGAFLMDHYARRQQAATVEFASQQSPEEEGKRFRLQKCILGNRGLVALGRDCVYHK